MSIFNYGFGESSHDGFSRKRSDLGDTTQRIRSAEHANEFSDRLGVKAGRYSKQAATDTLEYTSGFNEFKMTDAMDDRNAASLKEGADYSEEAIEAIGRFKNKGPATSLKDYISKTSNRRSVLQRAKKSLGLAREKYKAKGVSITYDDTGYSPLEENKDNHLRDFDTQVMARANEYAKKFGHDSYEDMFAGYGIENWIYTAGDVIQETYRDSAGTLQSRDIQTANASHGGYGQRDVMDMIMADITGMSYQDLGELNQYRASYKVAPEMRFNMNEAGDDWSADEWAAGLSDEVGNYGKDYTKEQMQGLRDFYGQSQLEAVQNANTRALSESANRKKIAQATRSGKLGAQKGIQKISNEMLGNSEESIQMELRKLDENFMKNIGAFNTVPKKRKVPSISFVEGRPE